MTTLLALALLATPQGALPVPVEPRPATAVPAGTSFAVTNLGLVVYTQRADDDILGFSVYEAGHGSSLNGDDDLDDYVLHVWDSRTGQVVNLGAALQTNGFGVEETTVVYTQRESDEAIDLNGDGDTTDVGAGFYDPDRGTIANLGVAVALGPAWGGIGGRGSTLSAGGPFHVQGGDLVVLISEQAQGESDLDGDGDTDDQVLQFGPLRAATPLPSGSPSSAFSWRQSRGLLPSRLENRAFFHTPSVLAQPLDELQENVDLNGDGDLLDVVAVVFTKPHFVQRNLRLQSRQLDAVGDLVVVSVWEPEQGNTDLNGDGDASDTVPHVFDVATGALVNLGLAASVSGMSDRHVLLFVDEGGQGQIDLNGDGDTLDAVTHVWDRSTGTTTNLALAERWATVVGDTVALSVRESWQSADLNGDGDMVDVVFFTHDPTSGVTTNHGLALHTNTFPGSIESDRVVFVFADEFAQGQDLNGNGTLNDRVAFYHDPAVGGVVNTGLAATYMAFDRDRALVRVPEAAQGVDLNEDGDQLDEVIHLVDGAANTITNLGLAHSVLARPQVLLRPGFAAIPVSEADQGQTDLNGNGTTINHVLHIVHLP